MYEPVMEIAMNLSALTQFVTVGYGLVFPQNENINFSVITNPASGILLYTWLFEDGHPNVTTFYANTTHTYETFGEKNITVFAETCNHLSTNISVNVHPQIENARLACNESFTGYFNDTLELNVTADKWGIGGCVYIDYGDGTPPQMNCTSHIVSTVGFTIEEELNATNGLAINFTHKFPEPGIFNVTIIMNNTVSSELLLKTFNITPGPCFTPNVTLTGKFY